MSSESTMQPCQAEVLTMIPSTPASSHTQKTTTSTRSRYARIKADGCLACRQTE